MSAEQAAGISDDDLTELVAGCNCAIWWLALSDEDNPPSAPTPNLEDAPEWAVESTRDSVLAVLSGITMEQLWARWAAAKKADGWVHGEVKDPAAKTHPRLVDHYWQLSAHERFKDRAYEIVIQVLRGRQLARQAGTGDT